VEELAGVEHLKSLVELRVFGCVKLKSIAGLAQLKEFQTLHVTYCSEFEELPYLDV